MAADFKVDTTADGADKECLADCTLREAVTLAGSGDQVILPAGNYVLADGELVLNNDTIVGDNARTTFIDGADKSRVLRVIEVTSRVSGVTVRNGNGVGLDPDGLGGGIYVHSGVLGPGVRGEPGQIANPSSTALLPPGEKGARKAVILKRQTAP
jgi:CSLREA domain-containing protein